MKRSVLVLPLLALTACAGGARTHAPDLVEDGGPLSVVLFIGDGAGTAYWTAAKLASDVPLAVEAFPVVGLVDTRSSDSRVTDSAASATAYAAGIRTYNGAIAVNPDSTPARSVLELAESRGWATGLVATSTVTHATPASFAAHVVDRNMHFEIASQLADRGLDVLLGGGQRFFEADSRPDGVDLVAAMRRRAAYVDTPEALAALDMDTVQALVGLFAENNPGPATEREPSLAALTAAALDVLEKDRDGFFLMVEGSQIDWRGHENAPLERVVAEVQDFDFAIREGLRFQERRPNTLLIVLADHSTGGMALHADKDGWFGAHYTTRGHTAEMIPMFARGPGAEAFGGIMDNARVGRLLRQLVREEAVPDRAAGAVTGTGRR